MTDLDELVAEEKRLRLLHAEALARLRAAKNGVVEGDIIMHDTYGRCRVIAAVETFLRVSPQRLDGTWARRQIIVYSNYRKMHERADAPTTGAAT